MLDALNQVLAADMAWLWISARTFGICAWLASSAAVVVGLLGSTQILGRKVSRSGLSRVHRVAAAMTMVFVALHVASLVPDPYAKLTLLDLVIPGMAPNQTLATACGTIALLGLLVAAIAGIGRSNFSARAWRLLHGVAFIVWPLASIHFIMMGTDVMASWSLAMIAAVGGLLVLLLLRRGFVAQSVPSRRVDAAKVIPSQGSRRSDIPVRSSVQLAVVDVIDETTDARTFVFKVPAEATAAFRYLPGQHLTLRIPSDVTGSVARCYSLSSSPGFDSDLRVTVKRTPDGYGSNWLCDNIRPGMRVESLPPAGNFTVPDDCRELLLFAGGSGITPFMSMIKSATLADTTTVTLVYANRDEQSIIFRRELMELTARHPGRISVRHWLQSVSGIPSPSDTAEVLAAHRDAEVFVCGPAPFMDLVVGVARDFGWPNDRVHVEKFRSLTGDPFAAPVVRRKDHTGSLALATRTTVAQVELAGDSHVVDWPGDATLIEALLDAGVDAPYSCLEGACATCECKLVAGSVASSDASHEAGERVLGCQIRPSSETVRVQF